MFLCALDERRLDAHVYCAACVVLPEVDYLEAYRLQFFGKRRDGWSWLFGIGGLINLTIAISGLSRLVRPDASVTTLDVTFAAFFVPFGVVQLGWFFKQRWARVGLILAFFVLLVFVGASGGVMALPALIIPGAVIATATTNVRSKLFFELEVPREALRKDWALYHDNRLARSAQSMAIGSLIMPLFAPFAVVSGVVALRRVNPLSTPPVGNRTAALVGIVLGSVTTVGWLVVAAIIGSTR